MAWHVIERCMHHSILLLDERPEVRLHIWEVLRQPLEDSLPITIARISRASWHWPC
jgi:predicted ATPase with chaperone activity